LGTSTLVSCALDASTLVTLITSDFASASDSVRPLIAAEGIATRQPNQMLASCAPPRIVPRLDPVGRCDTDGTCGPC
jgi:hypothetical protein